MTDPAEQSSAPTPLIWIEIDETALADNVSAVRLALTPAAGEPPKIMAVVKANGYGHGAAAALAFTRGSAPVDALAVTTLDEALALIDAGIAPERAPILVFAPVIDADQADRAVSEGLTVTVCDLDGVDLIASAAQKVDKQAQVHLKVDTGMSRFGLTPDAAFAVAQKIVRSSDLRLNGVYTHFAQALGPGLTPTRTALARFTTFCDRLRATGIDYGLAHCANSAAALRLPESRLDMVRLGTVLYGQYPAPTVPKVAGLNPKTWSMKARAVFVHDVAAGATVGYGAEFRAGTRRRVAVLPVGFGDGFATAPISRYSGLSGVKAALVALSGASRPYVTFDCHRAPVLGRVAMQAIVVDVTDLPSAIVVGSIADIPIRRLAARSSIPRFTVAATDTQKKPAP